MEEGVGVKMKKFIFSEVGFGNETIFSTEVECGKKEYRVKEFLIPKKIKGGYIRIWFNKRVFIFSNFDGIKFQSKTKRKLKFLLGIQGVGL